MCKFKLLIVKIKRCLSFDESLFAEKYLKFQNKIKYSEYEIS